jgi:sorbitol/mannitol transport system permease protein
MSTQASRAAARLMLAPSVLLLLGWMIVPLAMTLWFSGLRYRLLTPGPLTWNFPDNYTFFIGTPAFMAALLNTLVLVLAVLLITVILGVLLALLLDQPMWGTGIVRIMVIAPFFVMPTVAALVWKNMFMSPTSGLFAEGLKALGLTPIDFFGDYPLASVIAIVSWEWLPFATLILLTALQSLDREQIEAAEMDGAGTFRRFWHIVLPHLARAITVVILIQTIFLLSIFAEIRVTTNGGPGTASTNLPFLVYLRSLSDFNVGAGAAGGVVAIILANIVAIFLMRAVGKNLDA